MYAALSGEVYLAYAGVGERYGSPEKRLRFPDEGKDAPVVVGVRVEIEDTNARGIPDRIGYARHPCFVSSFAEIRDGFEELGRHLFFYREPRAWSRLSAALMRPRWVSACGKLPRAFPEGPTSSA